MPHRSQTNHLSFQRILANPNTACPPEILAQQIAIEVAYTDFEGLTKTGVIEVNKDLEADVVGFFTLAHDLGFPIAAVTPASDETYNFDDQKLMAANASSGFNYRTIAGTDRPSLHGLGRAIDINPLLNPYTSYDQNSVEIETRPQGADYAPDWPGTFTATHPLVIFMKDRGWEWGGDWAKESGRIDRHHFQKAA